MLLPSSTGHLSLPNIVVTALGFTSLIAVAGAKSSSKTEEKASYAPEQPIAVSCLNRTM